MEFIKLTKAHFNRLVLVVDKIIEKLPKKNNMN